MPARSARRDARRRGSEVVAPAGQSGQSVEEPIQEEPGSPTNVAEPEVSPVAPHEEAPDARDLLGPMTQKTKVPDAQESDEIALCDGVTKLMKSEKYLYSFSGHSDVTYQETIPHHTFSAERHKPQWAKFEKQVAQITKERGFSALPEDIKKVCAEGLHVGCLRGVLRSAESGLRS